MRHPYEHSLINMNTAVGPTMRKFICWSLENEHGDLGLRLVGTSVIPLSKLGLQLRKLQNSSKTNAIIHRVQQNADGNVALAKLRLDILHGLNDVNLIEAQAGITPPSVTALLELVFNSTHHESVPFPQRRLALIAMTVVSQFDHPTGVSLDMVKRVIRLSEAEQNDSDLPNALSEDRIALSTKGLLSFGMDIKRRLSGKVDIKRTVYAYNQAFHTYLKESCLPVKEMIVKLGSDMARSGESWESMAEIEKSRGEIEEDLPVVRVQ